MSSTYTRTYSRTHTSIFVSDNIRNVLRNIIKEVGLDPTKLIDLWSSNTGRGAKRLLESEHLKAVVIEFYRPGSGVVAARWDFPISYDGSGSDDDMWISARHISRTIAKAAKPPLNAEYRIILTTYPGAPDIEGMRSAEFKSTGDLICRSSGTAISTPDIMAGLQYWK